MGPFLPQPCLPFTVNPQNFTDFFNSLPLPGYITSGTWHSISFPTAYLSLHPFLPRAAEPLPLYTPVACRFVPSSTTSGFPNPQQFTNLLSLLEQNLLSNTPHSYNGWMKPKCWMDFVGQAVGSAWLSTSWVELCSHISPANIAGGFYPVIRNMVETPCSASRLLVLPWNLPVVWEEIQKSDLGFLSHQDVLKIWSLSAKPLFTKSFISSSFFLHRWSNGCTLPWLSSAW